MTAWQTFYESVNIEYLRNSFHFKKDGAKRHPQIFNLQSSIFNPGLPGLGIRRLVLKWVPFTSNNTTAGGGVPAFDPGLNNIGGASHPRGHGDRFGGAVFGAGTALHAPV
jgi:hypothetical protein